MPGGVSGILVLYLPLESQCQPCWDLNLLPSLWVGSMVRRSHILSQSCMLPGCAKRVHLLLDVNNSIIVLNTWGRKETFSDISMLTNRCKENQAAFFLLCNCNRIVLVDKVSDIFACVILGKRSRKKKGLSQNPHATLYYTFSSSAGQQPSQEIKAIV